MQILPIGITSGFILATGPLFRSGLALQMGLCALDNNMCVVGLISIFIPNEISGRPITKSRFEKVARLADDLNLSVSAFELL